jgi:hypothetical protein
MPGPSLLDEVMPTWHWRTRSTAWVDAAAAEVFLAFEQVRMAELPGAAAARAGQSGQDPSGVTLISDLLAQGFFLLAEEPDHELVLGRIGQFWRARATVSDGGRAWFGNFAEPGFAKAAFALRVQAQTGPTGTASSLVSVESRVIATDNATRREFNRYWLVGSWANPAGRRQLLAALRHRATTAPEAV